MGGAGAIRRALVRALVAVAVLGAASACGRAPASLTAARSAPANASVETDANHDGVPDCWARVRHGTSTASFALVRTAHTGRHAEQLIVSRFASGSQALQVATRSACYPRATGGRLYRVAVWYRGHGDLRLTIAYRTAVGAWAHWTNGPRLSPATRWTLARFDTPAAPVGTTGVSFGLSLHSVGIALTDDYGFADLGPGTSVRKPPPPAGYLTAPVSPLQWRTLPGDAECARRVHRSLWEPRRDNTARNHNLVDPRAVHASFRARPRAGDDGYAPQWDSWLLARVDGQFTGTTDEIIQWTACKWGLPDNFLRAEADVESTWFQYEIYRNGRCVYQYSCGDFFSSEPMKDRLVYCNGIAALGGYDYQVDFGRGQCPKTFSIVGVMSWWNPAWGYHWALNQAGTFPFTRDSTAMALDYMASQIRGCYQGWEWQLGNAYHGGDLLGCAGSWYSGMWYDAAAKGYIAELRRSEAERVWLRPEYATEHGPCQPAYGGCPIPG
jgi:hypothetical protein